jgi:hypothetical protein
MALGVAASLIIILLVALFIRSADSGTGRAYRLVQYVYYRVGSLDAYQKSGESFDSAAHALRQAETPFWGRVVERLAPSQAGWFSSRFPTDKGGYHDYVSRYDALLAPYRSRPDVWLLEVGVKKGGSLVLWRELFDESAFIYGIDVNPDVPTFARDGHMKVLILDSRDAEMTRAALRGLSFDVIIDDGLHLPEAQAATYAALRPFLAPTGVYIIEDVYAIDLAAYTRDGVDAAVFPDRSGQQLVVLAPPRSLVRETGLWSQAVNGSSLRIG